MSSLFLYRNFNDQEFCHNPKLKFCSHANVALNLQPKTIETNESASASTSAEEARNREHKIRKTDDNSKMNAPFASSSAQEEKMELSAQSSNVEPKGCEDYTKQTLSKLASNNDMVQENVDAVHQEEKMEIDPSKQSTELTGSSEDDSDDIGEIHIVSKIDLKFVVFDLRNFHSVLRYLDKFCTNLLDWIFFCQFNINKKSY